MEVSVRTRELGIENSFSILKQVEDLQHKGKNIINFCIGQPDFDTTEHVKRAAKEAIEKLQGTTEIL